MSDRVTLFATCLGNNFFRDAVDDAIGLLRDLGFRVDLARGETCCGQPAHSSGYRREARRMAERTATLVDGGGRRPAIFLSGSCASMVRNGYRELLGERRGAEIGDRVFELGEFLARELGGEGAAGVAAAPGADLESADAGEPGGALPKLGEGLCGKRIAYHHGCHALRELEVRAQPPALLRACGAETVAWEAAEECCGFGGLFSTKFPEVSAAMADRKLDTLPSVDVLTSADPGCLMQLGGRLRRRGGTLPVRHLASLLREGMGAAARGMASR